MSSAGFTLIELVIVVAIMPLVIGGLSVGILSVLSLQTGVSNRLTDSGDAQVVASHFQNDVQSAQMITTSNAPSNVPSTSSAATCGSGFQVMGLYFGNGNVVSYSAVAAGSGGTVNLFRNVCNGDTQTSSEVMANDVPSSMLTSGGDTLAGVILTANSTSITISSGGSFTGVSNGQYLSGENVVPGTYVLSGGGTPTLTLNQSPVATTITESVSFPPVTILCTTTGAACAPVAPTNAPAYQSEWVTTLGITKVTLQTTEPESNYTYQLVGVPVASSNSTSLAQTTIPSTGCGFATNDPQSTYARTLCFVNFAPWNTQTGASSLPNYCSSGYLAMSAGVTGTPFTLNFCMQVAATNSNGPITGQTSSGETIANVILTAGSSSVTISGGGNFPGNSNGQYLSGNNVVPNTYVVSGQGTNTLTLNQSPIATTVTESVGFSACGVAPRTGYNDLTAVPLPTYSCPPGSEAYLGNNGFYTGVPGDPALYEVDETSTATVNINRIELLSSSGATATNWELVTGDAESTDDGESITWTSNEDLNLLYNSPVVPPPGVQVLPVSPVGNACMSFGPSTVSPPNYNTTYLKNVGTTTVECSSPTTYEGVPYNGVDHTGTPMLEAQTPSSLTVTMVGTGLQAMFLGVLLP